MNGDMNKMHTKIELRGKMYPRQMELQGKTLALQLHFPGYILPRNSIYVVHFITQLVFLPMSPGCVCILPMSPVCVCHFTRV